jgi:hypothetical protein
MDIFLEGLLKLSQYFSDIAFCSDVKCLKFLFASMNKLLINFKILPETLYRCSEAANLDHGNAYRNLPVVMKCHYRSRQTGHLNLCGFSCIQ